MNGACGSIGTGAAGLGMYGPGSRGRARMSGEVAVLAASELAKSRTCPGGSDRGFAATKTQYTINQSIADFYIQH